MKSAVKRGVDLTARCAHYSGLLGLLERVGQRSRRLLRVLTYHRVDQPARHPDLYPNLISATPEEFSEQMQCLARNYQVVDLAQVHAAVVRGESLPPKAVLITFDDAYQDFAEHAWPVLQKHRLPVTVFVPTSYPDHPDLTFWWDRLYAALVQTNRSEMDTPAGRIPVATPGQQTQGMRKLIPVIKALPDEQAQQLVQDLCDKLEAPPVQNRILGWESLRQLAKEGVTLAPHTQLHPLLNRVNEDRLREEIRGSIQDLKREIGDVLPVLAYPSGMYNRRAVEVLPSLGIELAFTTFRGVNDLDRLDPLRIRRFNIGRRTSPALLRSQLLPWNVHMNHFFPVPEEM